MSEPRIAELVRQACLLEAAAPKAGNVHPGAAFDDLCYDDFVRSADAAAVPLAGAGRTGVGRAVRDAVAATRQVVRTNTNLGICLLLAPLTAVPRNEDWRSGIERVLDTTTLEDARLVYEAIRLVQPGGLGRAAEQDVAEVPTLPLRDVMAIAADRDAIARQYATGFTDVIAGVETLRDWQQRVHETTAVVGLQLSLLARQPDTLIARKCGPETAAEASRRAGDVLVAGWPDRPQGQGALAEFDRWLRSDGHRRNPGATADLIAAILFGRLRDVDAAASGLR